MGAFKDFFNTLFDPMIAYTGSYYIRMFRTVAAIDKRLSEMPKAWRENPEVIAAYDERRAELEAMGLDTFADWALGWFGTQMANAIWAVTEHTLPQVLEWLDEFQEAYYLRTEELEAMKKLAESGEFGLNAVVQFMLYITIRRPATIAAAPFLEDLEHSSWAAHPSKLPTMADLVRMEYREVFRPEFRAELIEDEPISEDFEKYAARMGFSKAHAENYWGAHWDLPSRTQGYEMYHRLRPAIQLDKDGKVVPVGIHKLPATYSKPFELTDLNTLLKRQDVLKRYRDQLVEIAYKPFTRVDVRRMYRSGVLSFEEVIAAYLDAGYSPERALKMAEFTRAWVTEGVEKRETKGGVLDAMKTGIISEAEAETELGAFYPADVAKRYVDIAKVKNKLNMSQVGKLLGMEELDESDARNRFTEMGYPSEDVDLLIVLYSPDES